MMPGGHKSCFASYIQLIQLTEAYVKLFLSMTIMKIEKGTRLNALIHLLLNARIQLQIALIDTSSIALLCLSRISKAIFAILKFIL